MVAEGLTIAAAARALRQGEITSAELTEQCLTVIAARSGALNAFITVMTGQAREQARTADRERAAGIDRGPLHGIPVSFKDLIDVEGVPTTAASRVRDGHVAGTDAVVTARLRAAGAVFVGKTNLHEFAFGTTNEDSAYGPARHPLDVTRSPGGSSGGSAIAVATGMSLTSIGSDTGGSIRIPSAACGLVGLKATFGEISTEGVVPLSDSFDHVGPLCRSVEDARLVYSTLIGMPVASTPRATAGMRLAIPRGYFFELLDDEVASGFDAACARLTASGVRLSDVTVAYTDLFAPVYTHVSLPEVVSYHARTLEQMPERYSPTVRARLEAGRYLLAEDYVRAKQGIGVLRQAVDDAFGDVDALILPIMTIPAPPIGAATIRLADRDEPVRNAMLRLTQPFNVTGHPAIAIPCGATRAGLPISAQIVGRYSQTPGLLDIAGALEPILSVIPR